MNEHINLLSPTNDTRMNEDRGGFSYVYHLKLISFHDSVIIIYFSLNNILEVNIIIFFIIINTLIYVTVGVNKEREREFKSESVQL